MGADDETLSPATALEGSSRSDRALTEVEVRAGTTIGRYVVIERLGAGGMGVVYAALDPDLNRKVAVKLVTSGDQARVMREAQALARLSHPNVVSIHDVGTVHHRVFIAMELVDGNTLFAWVHERARPWREIVRMFVAAGRGLAAAHAAGIVHRDVKPTNIVVGRDGRVRVLDFGLARAAGDAPTPPADMISESPAADALGKDLTKTGGVLGTPQYMPPEAFRGEIVGTAGDQFSFCVALYEALYGEPPFDGNWLGDNDPPTLRPPPSSSRVPAWLHKAIIRGLAGRPAERHASMDVLLAALQDDPVSKRRRILAAAGGMLAVATVAALVIHERRRDVRVVVDPCEDAAALAQVWSPSIRDRMHQAFTASGKSDAEAYFTHAATLIDAAAKSWTDARAQVCASTMPSVERPYRLACLDHQKQDLEALLSLLQRPGMLAVENAVRAASALQSASVCVESKSLGLVDPPPEAARGAVLQLSGRIAELRALRSAGQLEDMNRLAGPLVEEVRKLGYAPLIADALYVRGELEAHEANLAVAQQDLEEAERVANASHADAIAARCAALMVETLAQSQSDRVLLDKAFATAQAWVERTGDLEAMYDLESGLYLASGAVGDFEQAIVHAQRAEAHATRLYGARSIRVVGNKGAQAFMLGNIGQHERAVEMLQQVIAIEDDVLGHDNPEIAADLDNLSVSLSALGRADEAKAVLERALALPIPIEGLRAAIKCDMCRALVAGGKPEEAIHWGRECLDRLEQLGVERMNLVINEDPLAAAYLGARHFKEALAQARRCLGDFRKDRKADTPDMIPCIAVEGTALLELGKPRPALASLEGALSLQLAHPGLRGMTGNLQFQVARALVASRGDRNRAKELADAAHADLEKYAFERPLLDQLEAWRKKTKI
jgi:tetratricopeptide (TPR) repeat protein